MLRVSVQNSATLSFSKQHLQGQGQGHVGVGGGKQ